MKLLDIEINHFEHFSETSVPTLTNADFPERVSWLEVELVSFFVKADSTSAHVTDADSCTHNMSVQSSVASCSTVIHKARRCLPEQHASANDSHFAQSVLNSLFCFVFQQLP